MIIFQQAKNKIRCFDIFRQKKGHSFNVIIARTSQRQNLLEKELLEDFNKVSIVNFPNYDESELKEIGLQMLNQKGIQLSNEDYGTINS